MPASTYPTALTPASWEKHKGVIAKVKPTGIGEALKALAKLHGGIDFGAFVDGASKTVSEAEAKLAALDGEARKADKAAEQARSVAALARKAEADFKASKLIPKSARDAAAAVAQAAADFARELDEAGPTAQAALARKLDALRAAAAKAAPEKEEDDTDLVKLKTMVVGAMRQAKSTQGKPDAKAVNFMIAEKGKAVMAYVTPRSVGESQKKVLRRLIGSESGVKFYAGEVSFDTQHKAWMFEGASLPTGGFGKKLQGGLKELTGTAYKLRVRKTGGEIEEVPGDSEDAEERLAQAGPKDGGKDGAKDGPKGAEKGGEKGADAAAAKALQERLKRVRPAIEKLVAAGDPRADALGKALVSANAAILALQFEDADKLLLRLESLATEAAKPPPSGRDTERASTDGVLSQITALVLGGIGDDTLRNQVNEELGKLKASFEKAEKIADAKTAEAGFRAVRVKADALLVRAQQTKTVADWLAGTLAPVQARAKSAVAALGLPAAKRHLQERLDALDAERERLAKALQLDALKGQVLAGMQKIGDVAAAADAASKKADAALAAAAQAIAAMGDYGQGAVAELVAQLQQRKAGDWPGGDTPEAIEKALADFDAELKRVVAATAALRKTVDERRAYEAAYAAVKADATKAAQALSTKPDTFTDAQKKAYEDAERGRTDAEAALDWVAATGSVGALKTAAAAILKAVADRAAYENARRPEAAKIRTARGHCYANKAGVPEPESGKMVSTYDAVEKAVQARDWVAAKARLAEMLPAVRAVEQVLSDGQAYYAAYATHDEKIRQAWFDADKATAAPVAVAASEYREALKATRELAAKREWSDAKDSIDRLQKAATAVTTARQNFDNARAPFDVEFNGITADLAKARAIVAAPPKRLVDNVVKAFTEAFAKVNDARNAGRFTEAIAAMPALRQAIADLLREAEKFKTERAAYENAVATVAKREQAAALAASAPPALSDAARAFVRADGAVSAKAQIEDWVGAQADVPALREACEALLKAKDSFNGAAKPADTAAFRKEVDALKPRTDKANASPVPAFVDDLQRDVRERLARIELLLGEKDLAAAQSELAPLEKALADMEAAKTRYAAHLAKFVAAREGEVKTARATALAPAKLAKARDDGLTATQKAIAALAEADKLALADAKVVQWIAEAKAWKNSKDAYDSLNTAAPDEAKLKALADLPGGGEVLDALVLGLPESTSTKVMSTALKARFGFGAKRFEKSLNKDAADLSGQTELDENLPDKSLQRTYAVLTRVPDTHLKGKVTELVDYNQASGGAKFSNNQRKIYMYCGRPQDNKEMTLGKEEEIVPAGETVDPACKITAAGKVPTYDHSLLHEAGHAQDLASGTMVGQDRKSNLAMGSWILHRQPDTVADAAATHFGVPKDYILTMLKAADSKPPSAKPAGVGAAKLKEAEDWCKLIRVGNALWDQPTLSKQVALNGRVYQEAYAGRWVSYDIKARAQGISAYQFRSEWEWFAELYAAYYTGKLPGTHPANTWLKAMEPPA